MTHKFGGIWTQKKLAVLEAYLQFYVTALKNQDFTLHYADAFAGSGRHAPVTVEEQEELLPLESFRGSVLTALDIEPGFDQYHFNDLNLDFVAELDRIKAEHPGKQILLSNEDANKFVADFCGNLRWNERAVLLLDPYSTQLDWQTLKHVAASKKVDLWVLFPLNVITRMTPRDGAKARPEWKRTLDRLLGTEDWEQALYKPVAQAPMGDLFGDAGSAATERLNIPELQSWLTSRFKELFAYVAEPVPLKNKGRTLFLFYFTVANDKPAAWGLAKKAVSHIISKNIGST